MEIVDAWELVKRSEFVDLGFIGYDGMPNIRKVFNLWQYKSMNRHFISTNTSSYHVRALLKNNNVCLYYSDNRTFQGLCLYGKAIVHFEKEYKQFFWNNGDEKYYPQGIEDEDYCIIEFLAEHGWYYGNMGKYEISNKDINEISKKIETFPIK